MSDKKDFAPAWVVLLVAIYLIRMNSPACAGPSSSTKVKQRGVPPVQTLKVPRVPGAAPPTPAALAAERTEDWVVLYRYPARPAAAAPAAAMDAQVERARRTLGEPARPKAPAR